MFATEDRFFRLLFPIAASVGLHAVAAALVVGYAAHPKPLPTPAGITVTIDAFSTSVAPGVETPPAQPPLSAPPSLVPDAAVAPIQPAIASAPPTPDLVATPAVPEAVPHGPDQPAGLPDGVATVPEAMAPASAEAQPAMPPNAASMTPPTSPLAPTPEPTNSAGQDALPSSEAVLPPAAVASGVAASPPAPDLALAVEQAAAPTAMTNPSSPQTDAGPRPAIADAMALQAGPPAVAQALAATDVPAAAATGPVNPEPTPNAPLAASSIASLDPEPVRGQPAIEQTPPAAVSDGPAIPEARPAGQAADSGLFSPGPAPLGANEAAPVPTAPAVTDVPRAPSTTLDDQAVAAPVLTARLEPGRAVAAMNAFVDGYDGGTCFYASVAHASADGAAIDVLSNAAPKFQAMNDAFASRFGLDPNVLGQRVAAAQCPLVDLLRMSRAGSGRMALQIDQQRLQSGDVLTGVIDGAPVSTGVGLFLVAENGRVEDATRYAQADGNERSFAVPIGRPGRGGPFPWLLVAIAASAGRPAMLTLDGSFDATRTAMAAKLILVSEPSAR